ncbi:MAG: phenylalanine--tRNA ligase subunit alpha, partial [Geminicoccaceae bacterium]|nr:phenylalanine--tRNA ligase subunit alpha [Geminicoccaceae bacterium]
MTSETTSVLATIDRVEGEMMAEIGSTPDLARLDELRVALLGKKGRVTDLVKGVSSLPPAERPAAGQAFNELKRSLEAALLERRTALAEAALEARLLAERIDVTLPARPRDGGRIHPVSQVTDELTAIFADMGFRVAEGPQIESDWY